MNVTNNELLADQPKSKTFREYISRYTSNWPFFLIILALCVGGGFLYARYMVPKYVATTSFLVKNNSNDQSPNDLITESLNGGGSSVNLNNVMLFVGSNALMERVVTKQNFNVTYYSIGKVLNIDIYNDAPFRMVAKDSLPTGAPLAIRLTHFTPAGGTGTIGAKEGGAAFSFVWNTPFAVGGRNFVLTPTAPVKESDVAYLATWRPVADVANEYLVAMYISPFDIKTSAIELSIKTENMEKCKAVLNAVFKEFNLIDIEERNAIAENTVKFIDDRLAVISTELKGVEGSIENFRGTRQLSSMGAQSDQSLSNSNDATKTIQELGVQRGVANMIQDYFKNPNNGTALVPSSLGINDATLTSLIGQYNELQTKRQREAPNVAPNSTVMQDLNTQTANVKNNIIESLNNISRNLSFREQNVQRQNGQYNSFLAELPHNERVMQEIKRQQGITEGLYLYLLRRREETAITNTALNIPHYKQTDLAKGYGPVEPNLRNWILISALVGIFIFFASIFLKDLMNDRVNNREDVTRKLGLQIYGEISHNIRRKASPIIVLADDVMSEQFRAIRTNLSFVLKTKTAKTILITSSTAGEGKSFISLNLAAVCAAPGKKVALLEFDLRKPQIDNILQFSPDMGLTNYLSGDTTDLGKICHVLGEVPTLHIYPAGNAIINPADLLLSENTARLFETLREEYDYIIIDTPPAGLVSDAFVLGNFSNLVLYVVRQRVTLKNQLDLVQEMYTTNKLNNMGIILNDMKSGGQYGYNDYGYGKYKYGKKKRNATA